MNRMMLVYISMLLVCAVGLWVILRIGSGIKAPTDLSGVWGVGGEDPTASKVLGETVTIEQSGRFYRLSFDKGLQVDLKLKDESLPDRDAGLLLDMILESGAWKLDVKGVGPEGPLIFHLVGPEKHTFTARRIRSGEPGDADGPSAPEGTAAAPIETARVIDAP